MAATTGTPDDEVMDKGGVATTTDEAMDEEEGVAPEVGVVSEEKDDAAVVEGGVASREGEEVGVAKIDDKTNAEHAISPNRDEGGVDKGGIDNTNDQEESSQE